ncbi:MAG: hypothetical protein ABSE69_19610 [Roseiarcus sp.]
MPPTALCRLSIAYIRLSETMGFHVSTAMRPQQFPLCFSDLLDEILSVQLADRVFSSLRGALAPTPLSEIHAIADRMKRSLTLGRAHSYGPPSAAERADASA